MRATEKTCEFRADNSDVILSTGFAVLRPTPGLLHSRYLFHWLRTRRFNDQKDLLCTGATQQAITNEKLAKLRIPLPSLLDQRRIADVLDRAEALRSTRIQAMSELDKLQQALFMDMFGNPITNSNGWPVAAMRDLATIERGRFTPRPRNDPSYYGGMYPFIQTGDISSSGGRVTSWTQTLNERGVSVSRSFPPGTVVIAIVGATLGMTAILDVEVYCPDSVVGIQPIPNLATAEYLEQILRCWRPIFVAQAPETARANINLETLRPLTIPAPPIALQLDYSRRLAAIENLRISLQSSAAQIDGLLGCLRARGFGGEL